MTNAKFDKLIESTRKLNDVTEEFHQVLETVDCIIGNLRPGIEVWLDGEIVPGIKLGYGRYGSKWCLLTKSEKGIKPLLHASRHARIASVEHLSDLLELMVKEADNLTIAMKMKGKELELTLKEITREEN